MGRILVTGCRGTLGAPFVAELRRRGHEAWGCDLRHQGDVSYVRADVLTEDIPLKSSVIRQNDCAVTKWVNEIQCINFEKRHGLPVVRLRFFNAYGPGEYYHRYRSVACLFAYRALHDMPCTVCRDCRRVFTYIDDFMPTLANVVENYRPGEACNIGGSAFRSVEELSAVILGRLGRDDSKAEYPERDLHNVQNKRPDISRAREAFGHELKLSLEEGVARTLDWTRKVYSVTVAP